MNRVCAAAWMLALMLGTACPVGGKAGVLNQALLRDEIKRLAGDGCQPADIEELCGSDGYKDCMEDCIARMERRRRK